MTEFFEQLQTFSERVFDLLKIQERVSPWCGGGFKDGNPTGAILHFTSGSDPARAIRWFMQKKYESQASAQVVVADGWPEEWNEFTDGLPLVARLPAAVVQCVPPDKVAWHATWMNRMCYGIEMVNAGELRSLPDGKWAWWPDEYTRLWESDKVPVHMYGRDWEPYTSAQVLAVVAVLREVQKLYGTLKRPMIVGHDQVTERKLDPGPLFPIHEVRASVYEPDLDPTAYQWDDGVVWRNELVMNWWDEVTGRLVPDSEAWESFKMVMHTQFLKNDTKFGLLGRVAMRLLGYHMDISLSSELTTDEKRSVEVFQKMMRLKVDGVPGFQTKAGIVARLKDRGILSGLSS